MSDAEEQWSLSTTLTSPAPLFSDEWLASEVWPAAGALISAIKRRDDWLSRVRAARLVVELGSGTGACGLAAAALGASRVMLTDQSSAIPLLLQNARQSRGACAVEVRTLEWRSDWSSLPADDSLPADGSLPADDLGSQFAR
ncbi:hypothetical protein AB1Y20_019025 [Prymnesium parvum]|uniref:Calmodulin-lysine N-methyltransferase n=1 Tax=Prymnesium parvum TaxID=97485 RepID=A0AB34JTZ7_PRYPA